MTQEEKEIAIREQSQDFIEAVHGVDPDVEVVALADDTDGTVTAFHLTKGGHGVGVRNDIVVTAQQLSNGKEALIKMVIEPYVGMLNNNIGGSK